MAIIDSNNLETSLLQVANIVNLKVLQHMLKPKDPRFETVDDVIKYAVENYSKIDDIFNFISEQLGIYLEFDREVLIEMVSSTYDDVRKKMIVIQLFDTIPYWWVIFPNKERLIEFLRAKVYHVASDMAKEMSIEDEKSKSKLDFTLPQLVSSIRGGMAIVPVDNPNEMLNILEKALYGKYMNEGMSNTIQPHLDATTPLENWNESLLKDIAETIKNSPALNDSLLKLGEELKNTRKSIEGATSPTLQELNKHLSKAINHIDKHFDMLSKLKGKEPTAEDGFKLYENLYELNNELNAINEIMSKLKEVAPQIEQKIRQQFAPALQEFMNDVQQQVQQFQQLSQTQSQTQPQPNIAQQMNTLTQNINQTLNNLSGQQEQGEVSQQQLPESEIYMRLINSIKETLEKLKNLSGSKKKTLEGELIVMIDNILKMNPPQDIVKVLNEIKKEVVS